MEFALVVIPLLIIVLGIISYGFMLSFRQSVSQAAAEGARAAAVAPSDADREAIAEDAVASAMGATCNAGYLTCTTSTPSSCGDCISVTVTYAYAADDSLPKFGFGIAMPEKLSYTATAETNQ